MSMASMNMNTDWNIYKKEHESFVSNLSGSTASHVLACLAHGPALLFFLKVVQNHRQPIIIRDYTILTIPVLLNMTVLAAYSFQTIALLMVSAVLYFYWLVSSNTHRWKVVGIVNECQHERDKRRSYLTYFRGIVVLGTCLAILAVDFQVFPRELAKTETFGVSMMDAGVGAFVVSSAMTSAIAREPHNNNSNTGPIHGSSISMRSQDGRSSYRLWLTRVTVLFLGVGRLIAVKLLGYHEHASEYGVHWNFFVTLVCAWTINDLLRRVVARHLMPALCIGVLIVYQLQLIPLPLPPNIANTISFWGASQQYPTLTDFVLLAPRDAATSSWLSANREGLCSLPGFLCIYVLTEEFASRVFFTDKSESKSVSSKEGHWNWIWLCFSAHQRRVLSQLCYSSCLLFPLWLACEQWLQPTSRRLTNLSYVLLVLSLASVVLLLVVVADAAGDLAVYLATGTSWEAETPSDSGTTSDSNTDGNNTSNSHGHSDRDSPDNADATTRHDETKAAVICAPAVNVASLEYFSNYQLIVFLAANLLTGAVNMSLQTVRSSAREAMAVLTVYSLAVLSVAWTCGEMKRAKAI